MIAAPDAQDAIRERIIRHRHRTGQTLQQVADAAGVSRAAVTKVQNRQRIPNLKTTIAIANALGVSVAYLIGETDDPNLRTA